MGGGGGGGQIVNFLRKNAQVHLIYIREKHPPPILRNLDFLVIFLHDQKVKKKVWISWEQKELLKDEIKSIFHHFKRDFIEANKPDFFGRWEADFISDALRHKLKINYKGVTKSIFHLH